MPFHPLDTIAAPVTAEREVERSRFLATLHPVADEDEANQLLAAARARWHDARHHASAMVLGPDGQRHRSSDDGEPAGTAGAPMLSVLVGAGLTDVVAVVTRWFGGTLLGAGGLVRAYGGTLSDAVAVATRLIRHEVVLLEVAAPLADAGRLDHVLHRLAGVHHLDVGTGIYDPQQVRFPVAVADGDAPAEVVATLAGQVPAATVVTRGRELRALPRTR
ncbi:MAG: IMPACT family protein [Nitriliruptoraceae bacterium]